MWTHGTRSSAHRNFRPRTPPPDFPDRHQETAAISGLLLDFRKEAVKTAVTALNLDAILTALETANKNYSALTDARSVTRTAESVADSKTVRAQLDSLYDDLVMHITAVNILTPSITEASAFLTALNQVIAETKADYNRRGAGFRPVPAGVFLLSSMALTAMLGLTGLPMGIAAIACFGGSFTNGVIFKMLHFGDNSNVAAVMMEPPGAGKCRKFLYESDYSTQAV